MPITSDRRARRSRWPITIALSAVLALAAAMAAPALGATEAQQGAKVLRNLQADKASCTSLATEDFDHVGEYVMERMLGSATTHEAMNRQMVAMMGASGETQAHVYMGQRFAGCASGRAPTAFGAMMGMMGAGMMGSASGASGSSSMMGGSSERTAAMMGSGSRNDSWSSGDTVMVVLMGLLLAVVAGVLVAWHPWRRPDVTPLETLRQRFARGDIDQGEFDRLRRALEGSA